MKIKTFILTFLMMSCSFMFGQQNEVMVNSKAMLEAALQGEYGTEVYIKLTTSLNVTSRIEVLENVTATLDLNGCTLTTNAKTYVLNNMGKLTIKDSSSAGTGCIKTRGIYNGSTGNVNTTTLSAQLTIESGTFENIAADGGAAIYNLGTAYIKGGKFIGSYAALHNRLAVMHIENAYVEGHNTSTTYGDLRNSGALYIGDNVYFYGKYSEENNGSHSGEFKYVVAKIGDTPYAELQTAINACTAEGEHTINILADIEEDVTVVQAPNVKIAIEGNDYDYKGTITVDGKSAAYATAGLTIKNVNFDATNISKDASINLGGSSATRYTNGVTVDNCTFTGEGKAKVAVKNYTGGCKNVTITNCTATGLHSLAQLKTSTTVTLTSNTVTDCKNGVSFGSSTGVTVTECTVDVDGYGVRSDGGSSVTVTDSEIEAFIPVVVRKASADASLIFNGENTMTASNEDGLWCVIAKEEYSPQVEYDENGVLANTNNIEDLTPATANVTVTLNGTGLNSNGIYGDTFAGTGTESDPYLISNLNDLKLFRNKVNGGNNYLGKFVKLTADIDLASETNWTPIGNSTNQFKGNFDGGNKTIKNLNIVEDEAKEGKAYIGFFGYANNVTIKNVVFENVNLDIACLDIDHSQGHIGAVAGSLEGTSTIENVTVKGSIKVEATFDANGASRVAVVAGGNSYGNVTMKNVHVIANEGSYLKANNNVGALAGQLQGKNVFENCSSNINVTGKKFFAGGIIGIAAGDSQFTNCHTTGDVTITAGREGKANDHYRVGGIAGGWADGKNKVCTLTGCTFTGTISGTNADGSVVETFDYRAFVGRGYTLTNCAGSKVIIDGVAHEQVYDLVYGFYKVGDVYEIGTTATLKAFRDKVNAGETYAGKTVKLINDINLNNEEWTPIGTSAKPFNGVFDGDDNTISNLLVNGVGKSDQGFFGRTNEGEIKNLTFNNAEVTGRLNVGVVAGTPYTSKYTNIKVTGHVEVNGMAYVGGVGGNAYANWTDITVEVDEDSYVAANSVENGTAYRTYVGGVIGFNGEGNHTFKNISSNIKVIGSTQDIGGIFGILHYGNNAETITFAGQVEASEGAEEVGAIAGVWHNQIGETVAIDDAVIAEGSTVKVGDEVIEGIVGGAYNSDNETVANSGSLLIDGQEAWLKVAQIGETKYITLQEAVTAAGTSETETTTINVIANTKEIITIQEGANITLNLANGEKAYTLEGYIAPFKGSLTINGGTIENTATSNSALEINEGELALNNVKISSARHAVRIDGEVNATIDGGTYKSAIGEGTGTYHAVNVSGAANVTIANGTFVGPKGTVADSGAAVNVQTGAIVTIKGGNFSGGKAKTLASMGSLVLYGGTYDQDPTAYCAENYFAQKDNNLYNVIKAFAKIGETSFASLQDAIDACVAGENVNTITLLRDINEDVTITQQEGKNIVIDGAQKTFTGLMTVFGNGRQQGTETLAINNINFVTKEGANACILSPDRVVNNKYSYAHNVTVENCTFTDPDGAVNCAAIRHNDGGDNDWTVKSCIVDATMHSLLQVNNVDGKLIVDNCTVKSKNGLNLNSCTNVELTNNTIEVKGYAVRTGVNSGGNLGEAKTYVFNNNTLKTDNTEGDAVIVFRASTVDANLSMEKNVVSGTTHISGHTAATKLAIDANYWDGVANPVATPAILVNSYYADAELQNLIRNEMGSIYAYVKSNRIFGDVTTNAKESLVISIIGEDGEVIGTSTLEKESYMTGFDKTLTWRINFGADDSDSWNMVWNEGAPSINNKPAKVRLTVDGDDVAEAAVNYIANGDGVSPVFAANTDATGKILNFIACEGKYNLNEVNTFLTESLKADGEVYVSLLKDVTLDITAWQTLAIGGANTTKITIDGENGDNDFTLTFNKKNSDWNNIATNNNATLVLKNMTITDSGYNNGPWNRYDLNFACNTELVNVNATKAIAFKAGATLNGVTINEEGDNYAIWIQPNGQTISIDGLVVNSAGRGIKIDNQYVNESALVTLGIENAEFTTAKKAAIMVKSPTGATITAENVNIENVAADQTNLVWVDADGAANYGEVTVTGATVAQEDFDSFYVAIMNGEKVEGYYKKLGDAIANVQEDEIVTLIKDINESTVVKINKSVTIDGNGKAINSSASRVILLTASDIDVTFSNLNVVSNAVRVGTNDIRGIAVDFEINGVELTLNNCSVDFTDASACDWAYGVNVARGNDHVITINGGTYEGANVVNIWGENNTVNIDGATLNSLYAANDYYWGCCLRLNENNETHTVSVKNTTFNGNHAEAYNVAGTMVAENNTDNTKRYVAKVGDTYYYSVNTALKEAAEGATVQLLVGTIDEYININNNEAKSVTIQGYNSYSQGFYTLLTGGMMIGVDNSQCHANNIVVKDLKFTGKGIIVASQENVTIENNVFENITELVATSGTANENAISVVGKNVKSVIKNNTISNVKVAGINLRNTLTATVEGNTISNTGHNSITITGQSDAEATAVIVKDNTLSNWAYESTEGRAMRISGVATVNANGNVMSYEGTAPEEFVKVTGATTIDASANYWNGVNPFGTNMFLTDLTSDPAAMLISYYTDVEKQNLVNINSSVAKIDNVYYTTLADAATAAEDGETIELLWAEGNAPISMAATFVGNKTVTITGTADVDWDKGWLYVGRNGEGNGHVIFNNANLTSASDSRSLGINVSGKMNGSNNTNNGIVEIKNSIIELDYMLNKNIITLDNSTLTVKNGFAVGGRPASETENGEDATATMTLNNNSKVIVNNHNGMGLGFEALGIMNINSGSTFETTQAFLVTANGTMNNAGNVNITGTLTNNGTINVNGGNVNVTGNIANAGIVYVTGTSDIAATKVTGNGWFYMNGVTMSDATVLNGAKVRFASGTNNINGSTINNGWFQVGIGVYKGTDANVDTENGVVVNVNNNAKIGTKDTAYAGWLGTGYYDTDAEKLAAMTNARYTLNINNSIAEFGYLHVSNDGILNVNGKAATQASYNGSEYSFRGGDFIINGTATFDATDVLAFYTKVSCDNGTENPGTLNIVNGTYYEAERHNGAVSGTNFLLYKTAVVNANANLHIGELSSVAADATFNIGGTVTALGTITNNGVIELTDLDATLTTPEGPTVITNIADHKVVYENGAYVVTEKLYVASIGDNKYETLQEAFDAAENDATIVLFNDKVDVIPMNASLYGKDVTITTNGVEVTVNWWPAAGSWLFVGRGGEGDATLTFDNAKIKAASANSGIHVSGREKNTTTKYDGTLVIKDSEIQLTEFINRNVVTIENSTVTTTLLTTHGRPASETEGGSDATATFTLTNSTLKAKKITNGSEGYGIMNVDATSNVNVSEVFNVTKGRLESAGNITGSIVKAEAGTIQLSGGIYTTQPGEGWCAENYGAFPYDENSWIVRMVYGTQEFTLTAGWNWMSSYISEFNGESGMRMLTNCLGDNGVQIKNNKHAYSYAVYEGQGYWTGQLNSVSVKEMYKVNVTDVVEFSFEGNFVNYDELEIPLYPGWNYIGYPVDVTTNITDALIISGGGPNANDVIKSQNDGSAMYAFGSWKNELTLIPGEGYMYKNTSGSIKTLKYSTKVTTTTPNNRNRNHWTVDATQYPSNMTMIATVDVEGGNYEVAAFVNGEVRGSARPIYVEELDAHILILTISGNDVEEMTFMYYDIATGEEFELSNRINYSDDAIVGSIAEPYILTRGTTGIGENSMSEISIYPNPTTTGTAINLQATCDRVEVYNALGVKVAEYQNVDSIDAIETAGIYVIRITNDGNVQNCRLVVK